MAVEALVGFVVERVASSLADAIAGQLRAAWGLEENLEELKPLLLEIQSVLADAEEKQTVDAAVKTWLDDLKKVAYEAEDVLDELNYETLRHKATEVASHKIPCGGGKVRDFFSSHHPLHIRSKMGRKVNNLLEKIQKIAARSKLFNFSKVDAQPATAAPVKDETCSSVKESEVVGRRGVKDEIVKMLIDNNPNAGNVSILPIVGMGGLVKTTLAQLVYNDPRVVDYFELRAWVCVSDRWDAKKIIQQILDLVTKEKFESASMERLHLALKEALTQRRFLIVLDDVWEEDPNKWDTLKNILDCGGRGSAVIVTTRTQVVSQVTGTLQSYNLSCLSDDESWDLFSKRAFAPEAERSQELVEIGKAIANKCGGLPLALRMLGSLLYMERDKSQWLKIKESDIWNIKTDILPALRLSYKHLPLHTKQCFTFCAIFPKDYGMEKEKMINLWMAHGFIPSNDGRLQVKGNAIFNQLVQKSFLQDLKEEMVSYGCYHLSTTCRMHDLVHDLALSIAGNDFVAVQEESSKAEVVKNAYHLSFSSRDEFNIKHTMKAYPYLRTILQKKFTTAKNINMNVKDSTSLRVLTLDAYILKLPSSMKCLQHLRYLQLLIRELSELPESICTLFSLQTLDLSRCQKLRRLPKSMSCMISLRHLYLDGCEQLTTMALCMGRLTNLQTLTLYVVGEESGRGIGELQGLQLSSGLKLRNLRSVKDVKEAKDVNLHSKEVPLLSLDWTGGPSRGGGEGGISNVEQVLEELKPPGCIKELEILGYEGVNFPKWMRDRPLLKHLVKLRLNLCRGLQRLPPLWQLSSLEELSSEGMKNLKYLISDNPPTDGTTAQAFPSLKTLKIEDLESLENWRENENAQLQEANCFPALVDWKIINCPEIASSLPLAPCLKSLELAYCKKPLTAGFNQRFDLTGFPCCEL